MDPNQTLADLRELVSEADGAKALSSATGYRFAELFDALDGWIVSGGFLPSDWVSTKVDPLALRAMEKRSTMMVGKSTRQYREDDGPKYGG